MNYYGTRFSTAVATDDARVNLAFTDSPDWVRCQVVHTDWEQADQPANGDIAVFTTEPHGVLPQSVRPGEQTAVFFTTLYTSKEAADPSTTSNTEECCEHEALSELKASR
jgi:hypothetical protein